MRHKQRDRFKRLADAQYAWHEADRLRAACDRVMQHLLETGHDEDGIAYHTLWHVHANASARVEQLDVEMEALMPQAKVVRR